MKRFPSFNPSPHIVTVFFFVVVVVFFFVTIVKAQNQSRKVFARDRGWEKQGNVGKR